MWPKDPALRRRPPGIHPPNTIPMRTIRSVAIAGYILGILFKILHWPGASFILPIGGVLTVAMLAPLLFRKPGPLTVQLNYPALLIGALMAVIIGGLLKIMHWPGANFMLLVGLSVCAAWFLIPARREQATTV